MALLLEPPMLLHALSAADESSMDADIDGETALQWLAMDSAVTFGSCTALTEHRQRRSANKLPPTAAFRRCGCDAFASAHAPSSCGHPAL